MSSHLPLPARDEAANGRFGSSDLYVFPNLTYARVPSSVSFSFLIDIEYQYQTILRMLLYRHLIAFIFYTYIPSESKICAKMARQMLQTVIIRMVYLSSRFNLPVPNCYRLVSAGLFCFRYPEFFILRFPDRHSRFRFYFCIKI